MAETKFTPGPWQFGHARGNHFTSYPELSFADGSGIPLGAISDADGRLIAAAPDLYEAAQLLEAAEEAHANCPECDGGGVPELCPVCFPLFDDARLKRRAALAKAEGR